jgi:HEAT repeat protein
MWEFWWDFHHEPLLDLRKALFARTPSAGVIDFPFEKITDDDRRVKLVRRLLMTLKAPDQATRSAAVVALARTRDPNIIPYIEATYLDDGNLNVRTMAVIALGITQNPRAVNVLKSIINDEKASMEIRLYAIVSLGLLGGEEAAVVFRDYLEANAFKRLHRDLMRGAAFGAGLTGDPTLAPLVRSLLINRVSGDNVTDSYLVISLGRLGDRAANPIILQFLEKGSFNVRRSSAIALGVAASPADKDVIQALAKAAESDADLMVKNFCYVGLGRIGGADAEKVLVKAFKEVNLTRLPFVAIGLGLLGNPDNGDLVLQRFKSIKDNSTRSALALTLGLLGHKPALGELRKVVDGKGDPIFRSYCAQALGLLRDADSIERLRKTCSSGNDVELIRSSAIALGLIGDSGALELLRQMADSKNSTIVRSSAVYAMGLIGDRNAIGTLNEILDDESVTREVKSYAVTALGLLGDENPSPAVSKVTRNSNYTIMETYLYELFNIN